MLQPANAILQLGRTRAGSAARRIGGLVVAARARASGSRSMRRRSCLPRCSRADPPPERRCRMEASNFLAELAEGWREFSSRTWLWVIVLQFGFVNAMVLGVEGVSARRRERGSRRRCRLGADPDRAVARTHGRRAHPPRVRPQRLLLPRRSGTCSRSRSCSGWRGRSRSGSDPPRRVGGIGSETFRILWDTTIQQEIPQEKLSRVSYDALGSFALIPLGLGDRRAGRRSSSGRARRSSLAASISLTATLAVLFVATSGRSGVARTRGRRAADRARPAGRGARPSG